MTFSKLKQICNQVNGKLFVKNNEYTDEVFMYYYRDDEQEVWLIIDDFDSEPISETAQEICTNLSKSDAKDTDVVKVLYTDTLTDIIEVKTENGDVYLYTE